MDGVLLAFCGGLTTISTWQVVTADNFFNLTLGSFPKYLTANVPPPGCPSWWYVFKTAWRLIVWLVTRQLLAQG